MTARIPRLQGDEWLEHHLVGGRPGKCLGLVSQKGSGRESVGGAIFWRTDHAAWHKSCDVGQAARPEATRPIRTCAAFTSKSSALNRPPEHTRPNSGGQSGAAAIAGASSPTGRSGAPTTSPAAKARSPTSTRRCVRPVRPRSSRRRPSTAWAGSANPRWPANTLGAPARTRLIPASGGSTPRRTPTARHGASSNWGLWTLADELKLDLGQDASQTRAAERTLDHIAHGGFTKPWLLVYDNADHVRVLDRWRPRGGAHLLVTSRLSTWSKAAKPIEIEGMAA